MLRFPRLVTGAESRALSPIGLRKLTIESAKAAMSHANSRAVERRDPDIPILKQIKAEYTELQ
jgi:hypothetical protein